MNKKILIALAVIVVAAAAVAAVFLMTDGAAEDNKEPVSAVVYIDGLGDLQTSEGTGTTVREILTAAFPDLDISYRSNGSIYSISGVENSGSYVWAAFRWASPDGWAPVTPDTKFIDGMSLAVSYTRQSVNSQGVTVYETPDIDVEYKVYFFVQFKEQYDANDLIRSVYTEEDRKNGFWISGTGENTLEALKDAVFNKGLVSEEMINSFGKEYILTWNTAPRSFGELLSFFGWSDTQADPTVGEWGTWTYWSQYSYNPAVEDLNDPKEWTYNNAYLGFYDITEYKYFALILQTTLASDANPTLPCTPSDIPDGL